MTDRPIPERKQVKAALRDTGLSNRQVSALLRNGWKSLVGETEAENQELKEQLNYLRESVTLKN
ncbi:MAG: hypothetical protein RIA65_14105 [Woeseia sp.]